MKKSLSVWHKLVKMSLIWRDMTTEDLAKKVNRSREYTTAVINGSVFSRELFRDISDVLNIYEIADSIKDDVDTASIDEVANAIKEVIEASKKEISSCSDDD